MIKWAKPLLFFLKMIHLQMKYPIFFLPNSFRLVMVKNSAADIWNPLDRIFWGWINADWKKKGKVFINKHFCFPQIVNKTGKNEPSWHSHTNCILSWRKIYQLSVLSADLDKGNIQNNFFFYPCKTIFIEKICWKELKKSLELPLRTIYIF